MPVQPVTAATADLAADRRSQIALVDADVHTIIPPAEVSARLSARWRRYYEDFGLRGVQSNAFIVRPRALACRTDAWPPGGGAPGSDLPFLAEQLLDTWNIDYAVLDPIQAIEFSIQRPDFGAALSAAYNDWTREAWLDKDDRLISSIVVPVEDARLAAAEIERVGSDRRFVQVGLVCRTRELLGDPKYWPMYEAAVAHDLPIAIHVGGLGNNLATGAGLPSYYVEDHVAFVTAIKSHLMSLVFQGVFERFPTLRFVLQEGGFAWAPAQMWAMDRAWSLLKDEVPQLQRRPSEYVRDHFWFTTQPIEEPDDVADLHTILRHLRMDDHIMFATDYPHWDFDAPDQSLPRGLDPVFKRKLLSGNACDLYGLPR